MLDVRQHTRTSGHFQILSLENGKVVWESPVMKNLVLNSLFSILIDHHNGDASTPLEITSIEIGDGNTAVTGGDTALDNMIVDAIPPARVTPNTNSIEVEFFVVDGDLPDGTYYELGLRAGSTLITRALFTTPYTKVSGRDTIIRYTLSYAAA